MLLATALVWSHGIASPASNNSFESARRAQAMLGAETWSRLIKIENRAARSAYPRKVFALVFEFAGILWFYTDSDGTQSFSLHRNNLAEEKSDFWPLLRDIEPGFVGYEVIASIAGDIADDEMEPLRNGCFIESIAALGERIARGDVVIRAGLLSYYAEVDGRRRGHTVLVYESPRGAYAVDANRAFRIGAAWKEDALEVARRLRPRLEIERARWVPITGAAELAGLAQRSSADGKVL